MIDHNPMKILLYLLVVLMLTMFSSMSSVTAAPGGIHGPPDNGGSNLPPVDYGDLIILLRDEYGVPMLTADGVDGPGTGLCQQPVAFNVSDEPGSLCPSSCLATNGSVLVDQSTCAIAAGCSGCTHEVEFGRMNEARSSEEVFDSQLEDVIVTLATADCLTLDPAGRVVASKVDDLTMESQAKTIDSPLQNLAIYRELLLKGTLGAPLPEGAGIMETAARGLGAASDKTGEINVDLIAYLNQVMGLSDKGTATILGNPICIDVREEVQGSVDLVEKCFLDYSRVAGSEPEYNYARLENFAYLPSPAYITLDYPTDGQFEYLTVVDPVYPLFTIQYGQILDAVFCNEEPVDGVCFDLNEGYTDGNIGGFAQAADDTRAVISYMHSNQVPEAYETAIPCTASSDIFYDLSISDESGLQVPKNYVNGSEREFIVTVGNAGPDMASGNVTITAETDEGVYSWSYDFVALPAGQSVSFPEVFSINTSGTQIAWNASVAATPPGTDPNPGNNSVDATSNLKASGGGGGNH